jgi:nitrite reductase/ring-hydroxylating ferredoxin subunit
VIFTLLWLPFGKFFHIFRRPAQLGVSFYKDIGAIEDQARCRHLSAREDRQRQFRSLRSTLHAPVVRRCAGTRQERYFCPCHNGSFDLETGKPLAGPPRRQLARINLEIVNDTIYATGVEFRAI